VTAADIAGSGACQHASAGFGRGRRSLSNRVRKTRRARFRHPTRSCPAR
jgi:hypothetical protein